MAKIDRKLLSISPIVPISRYQQYFSNYCDSIGIMGQVWYLIVSISYHYTLTYFYSNYKWALSQENFTLLLANNTCGWVGGWEERHEGTFVGMIQLNVTTYDYSDNQVCIDETEFNN